jgi:hypothetical protein
MFLQMEENWVERETQFHVALDVLEEVQVVFVVVDKENSI